MEEILHHPRGMLAKAPVCGEMLWLNEAPSPPNINVVAPVGVVKDFGRAGLRGAWPTELKLETWPIQRWCQISPINSR